MSSVWLPPVQRIPDETILGDARLTNYLAASAIAVLVADYFATIHEEVEFVWNRRWSIPSFLYLWVRVVLFDLFLGFTEIIQNRYMTMLTVISCLLFMFKEINSDNSPSASNRDRPANIQPTHRCRAFIAEGLVSTLLVISFDLMLTLRVWVLYGKTRRGAWLLFPLLLAELGSMLVILLLPATYLNEFVHLGPRLPGCYFTTTVMRGPYFALFAAPPLFVTFLMFILTVYKCSKVLSKDKSIDMPIITLFMRDGIIWFVIVFGIDGAQMIVWAMGRATLTQVLIIPSLVLYSLVSSRVILNTKSLSGSSAERDDEARCETKQLLPDSPVESDDGGSPSVVDRLLGDDSQPRMAA
ncbi:hypothetical protein B0H16DRAFT_1692235 [Mycena metata]|uniref:DUF6533 domain-containing protein n=1 Tax=Mycena metata TaxID=1033252 RepID=A0AAD7IQH6_9AGAR|nr:hypothetical protein B0H16DRAFT_1692235 [Mycena metata]